MASVRRRMRIDKGVLNDQAEQFMSRGDSVRNVLDDGQTRAAIDALESKGLGWDPNGRVFSLPYWNQQAQVIAALRKVIADFHGIHDGLLELSSGMSYSDSLVAAAFKKLNADLPDTSQPLLPQAPQTDPVLRRWPN